MNYLFDVDGTLTPSRLKIDSKFEQFFLNWMKDKNVYLVTGSDKDKTIEQVGEKIWLNVTRAYQSCGNAVYENGKLIRQSDFKLDVELQRMLFTLQACSDWKHHHGNHIEERIGLVNYSTIGRNCDQSSRNAYYDWDRLQGERKLFCKIIENVKPSRFYYFISKLCKLPLYWFFKIIYRIFRNNQVNPESRFISNKFFFKYIT